MKKVKARNQVISGSYLGKIVKPKYIETFGGFWTISLKKDKVEYYTLLNSQNNIFTVQINFWNKKESVIEIDKKIFKAISKNCHQYVPKKSPITNEAVPSEITHLYNLLNKLDQKVKDLEKYNIHSKIFQLYQVTQNIFNFLSTKPEKARTINQFIEYYLPTTITLLESYEQLISTGSSTENIKKSTAKIEELLDILQKVYDSTLDSLFKEKALDIDAEMSLIKTLISTEHI